MVNVYLNLSIFTVFLKNRNIIFRIRRSKVTDYAALIMRQFTETLQTLRMSLIDIAKVLKTSSHRDMGYGSCHRKT